MTVPVDVTIGAREWPEDTERERAERVEQSARGAAGGWRATGGGGPPRALCTAAQPPHGSCEDNAPPADGPPALCPLIRRDAMRIIDAATITTVYTI